MNVMLDQNDFMNIRRVLRHYVELHKDQTFDDAQVVVLLDSKIGQIMGQQQQAAMKAAVDREVEARQAQQQEAATPNDVS